MAKISLALGMMVALVCASAGNASTELVLNGGFETGDFTSWTNTGNTGFSGVTTAPTNSGSFAAFFGPIGSDGFLSQTLTTTMGELYDISFWLSVGGGTPNDFGVMFGATSLFSVNDAGGSGFAQYSFLNVAASSAAEALTFNFRHDPDFWYLDDVSVTASVPVPAALPMLLIGLGSLGFVGRRARKTSV